MKNNAHRFIAALTGLFSGSNKGTALPHLGKQLGPFERLIKRGRSNPFPVRQYPRRRHNGPGQHKHWRSSIRYRYQNGLGEFAGLHRDDALALRHELGF